MIVLKYLWRIIITLLMATVGLAFFLFNTILALIAGIIGWDKGVWLVSRMWSYGTFALLFTRINIKGKENLQKGKRVILISNHSSLFDILALYLFTPNAVSWLAKESLFRIPIVGWMLAAIGSIPVDRGNARKTQQVLNAKLETRHEKPWICIFPEGTRSKDGNLQSFKKGFIRVMRTKEMDLQPVTLNGFFRYKPNTSQLLIDPFVDLEIVIHPVVKYETLKDKTDPEILALTKDIIEKSYFR